MSRLSAIIFDLDGVLADSETWWSQIDAKLLAEYVAFCNSYYKQHGYRCNVVNGASRLHQDKNSLFSVSFAGPMFTLEPSSTGDRGWDDFLIDFNEFASAVACSRS